ncbi:MAG: hypothetical protein JSR46_01375 [Verrucomicrobia bacterium]|nr:hypothetical protein [Verrucomicrobiota bacterium]
MNNTCPVPVVPVIPVLPGPLFPVNSANEHNLPTPQEVLAVRILFTALGVSMTAVLARCTLNAYRILRGTHLMKVPMCMYGPIAHCKPIEKRSTCEKISMCGIMVFSACYTVVTGAATAFFLYQTQR